MQLFWKQGYESTSLQELVDAAGLSKSSFYQAFGSKHALFCRCLSYYEDGLIDSLEALRASGPGGLAFLCAVIAGVADETRGPDARRGCLIMNTASEIAQTDAAIARCVRHGTRRIEQVLRAALDQAATAGEVRADLDPTAGARYVLATISGLKTMAKAGYSRADIAQAGDLAVQALLPVAN